MNIDIESVLPSTQNVGVPLTPHRLQEILKEMKNNTAPGPSGVTKHTFLFLCKLIPNTLAHILNHIAHTENPAMIEEFRWIFTREIIFIPKNA